MHRNSLRAYAELRPANRRTAILAYLWDYPVPQTDRAVMRGLGFADANAVRPRITEMVECGLVRECGDTKDHETGKTVRTVTLTAAGVARAKGNK